jgi:hypothetical protein
VPLRIENRLEVADPERLDPPVVEENAHRGAARESHAFQTEVKPVLPACGVASLR